MLAVRPPTLITSSHVHNVYTYIYIRSYDIYAGTDGQYIRYTVLIAFYFAEVHSAATTAFAGGAQAEEEEEEEIHYIVYVCGNISLCRAPARLPYVSIFVSFRFFFSSRVSFLIYLKRKKKPGALPPHSARGLAVAFLFPIVFRSE